MRMLTLLEGQNPDVMKRKDFACARCGVYQKADWNFQLLINAVNLSLYPSPCQCNCFYCGIDREWRNAENSPAVKKGYENLFAVMRLAKQKGLINPNALWQVSSGEITIHPYKKEIFELIRNQQVNILSNCFKCDEDILRELHDNPRAAINLSIDSGTAETWHKVKGFDNFDKVVTGTLSNYYKASSRPGQITLKYILFPGINDTDEDFVNFAQIVKKFKAEQITISRDTREMYDNDENGGEWKRGAHDMELLKSLARFMIVLNREKIAPRLHRYTPEEQKIAFELAQDMMNNNRK